jgi:hypothetical protein
MKMICDPNGAVFWDDKMAIRRWGQLCFDKQAKDVVYELIPITSRLGNWYHLPITKAVVDDFGNLRRIE